MSFPKRTTVSGMGRAPLAPMQPATVSTSALSAKGSRTVPKTDCCEGNLRAIVPSSCVVGQGKTDESRGQKGEKEPGKKSGEKERTFLSVDVNTWSYIWPTTEMINGGKGWRGREANHRQKKTKTAISLSSPLSEFRVFPLVVQAEPLSYASYARYAIFNNQLGMDRERGEGPMKTVILPVDSSFKRALTQSLAPAAMSIHRLSEYAPMTIWWPMTGVSARRVNVIALGTVVNRSLREIGRAHV